MSVVGDAQQVRHLRAANKSWAVWTMNDDGRGDVFVVRERTGSISVIGGLRTDGTDFSERVVPVDRVRVLNFHCLEVADNEVVFMFSDGASLFTFTWNVVTNLIVAPVTFLAIGDIPSQFTVNSVPRQFYVRDRDVKVKVGGGSEITIIDPTATEAGDQDVVRKADTFFARYAGTQSINRDLALPMKADANTILLYDGAVDTVSVTEALPPGVVSYWTFDTGDFIGSSAVDIVGGNNASLVGAAPVSIAGQVGQAREFLSGAGTGYYDAGNVANLRITGQLSLSWWMRLTTLQGNQHPISKGYGGEYATVINSDGSGYFYYGTFGGNGHGAPYFGYLLSAGTFKVSVWTHVAWTRDFVNKIVRCYIDGKLVLQKPTQGSAAAVSTGSVQLGQATSWTNSRFSGRLDEVIVANQAWSPQSVAALYAKGFGGIKANVSGGGSAARILDASPDARHAVITAQSLSSTLGRTAVGNGDSILVAAGTLPVQSSAFTVEVIVYPRLTSVEALVYSSRAELIHSSGGVRNQGGVELAYASDGSLRFRFDTASATVEFRQESGERLRYNSVNHVAVSHTFGSAGDTLLVVNGSVVTGRWIGGSGNEVPSLSAGAPSLSLGTSDQLAVVRVSNVAKTLTQIREYLRGRL
jgi:hypothetical protein